MAGERRKVVRRTEDAPKKRISVAEKSLTAEERIARVLGLMLVRPLDKRSDQVTALRRAGFDIAEVAAMLNVTENQVAVMEFQGKKKS